MSNAYLSGSTWQLAERMVNLAVGLLVTVYLMRHLGPGKYGIWSYAQSYMFLFSSLTTLGLQSVVVRELAKRELPAEQLLGSALLLMFGGSVLMVLVCAGSALLYQGATLSFWMILLVAGSNIFLSLNVISFYFQAVVKTKYTAMAMLLQDVLDAVGKLAFIFFKWSLLFLGVIYLVEVIMMVAALSYLYFRQGGRMVSWSANKSVAISLLKSSLPLGISGSMIALYMRLDQVLLEYFHSTAAVGEYSAGIKIVELWYMLPMILLPNLLPMFVQAHKDNQTLYNKALQGVYSLTFWVPFIISIIMTCFASPLTHVLFGQQYQCAGVVLQIAIWGCIFTFYGVASNLFMLPNNLQRYALHKTLLGLLVCLVGSLLLIPAYGVVGAAIATLLGYMSATLLANVIIKPLRQNAWFFFSAFFNIRMNIISLLSMVRLKREGA